MADDRTSRPPGRPRQRQRTRKDLLRAAARLLNAGIKPSLDEVAAEAMVSRATAYRYFPNADALLLEASLDVDVPDAEEVLDGAPEDDLLARLQRVDDAFERVIRDNEVSLRMMLAKTLEASIDRENREGVPLRQNRRVPLIEAALAPARRSLGPQRWRTLTRALSMVIATEGWIVLKDVLQLDEREARAVRRWALRAFVEAAQRQ